METTEIGKRNRWPFKRLFVIITSLVILLLAIIVWFRARDSKPTEGIYLVAGGQSYLVLEAGRFGGIKVRQGIIPVETAIYDATIPKGKSIHATYRNNHLFLTQDENRAYSNGIRADNFQTRLTINLKKSASVEGDWDLFSAHIEPISKNPIFQRDYWRALASPDSFSDFFESLSTPFKSGGGESFDLDPAKSPIKSFLHRIDEPRLIPYFNSRLKGEEFLDDLKLLRELTAAHSGDPYLELHLIETLARREEVDEAARQWDAWQVVHGKAPDKLLRVVLHLAWKELARAWLKMKSPQLAKIEEVATIEPSPDWNLPARLKWLKDILDAEQLNFSDSDEFLPAIENPTGREITFPNFLNIQTMAKVAVTLAIFRLFEGKRAESLELFAGVYRLSQSLNADGTLISRLIGIAVRSIAIHGLQIYVLNACETLEECERLWKMLERLQNTPGQEDGTRLFEGEYSAFMSLMRGISPNTPNYLEAATRHHVADMKFQLVRMATAARYHYVTSGQFPKEAADFGPFLKDGLPTDYFVGSAPLRFTQKTDEFAVYSIGPDRSDNKAAVQYDPTNGTASTGDIFIAIPREREFPFPAAPVHAANARGLLEQFPNGLPADAFADTKGLPFSIDEATSSHPVRVFSFGPDIDEKEAGDFILGSTLVSPIQSKEKHSPGFYRQRVFQEGVGTPPWRLGPYYDPTNGTNSEGDLYIEIPQP